MIALSRIATVIITSFHFLVLLPILPFFEPTRPIIDGVYWINTCQQQ